METWLLFALISMFFAGLTSVLAKLGLKNMPADVGLAVRTAIVFLVVCINFLLWHKPKALTTLGSRDVLFLMLSGLTTAFSWIFYYKAIHMGPVSMIASIDKGSIVLTILLSALILGEEITPKVLLGGGLILAGLLVLVWK